MFLAGTILFPLVHTLGRIWDYCSVHKLHSSLEEFQKCSKRTKFFLSQNAYSQYKWLIPLLLWFSWGGFSRFLDEVQAHSSINKMSVQNLATVFGPNILRPKMEDPLTMMEGRYHSCEIIYRLCFGAVRVSWKLPILWQLLPLDCRVSNKPSNPFHQCLWGDALIGLCYPSHHHWPASVSPLHHMEMPLLYWKLWNSFWTLW